MSPELGTYDARNIFLLNHGLLFTSSSTEFFKHHDDIVAIFLEIFLLNHILQVWNINLGGGINILQYKPQRHKSTTIMVSIGSVPLKFLFFYNQVLELAL